MTDGDAEINNTEGPRKELLAKLGEVKQVIDGRLDTNVPEAATRLKLRTTEERFMSISRIKEEPNDPFRNDEYHVYYDGLAPNDNTNPELLKRYSVKPHTRYEFYFNRSNGAPARVGILNPVSVYSSESMVSYPESLNSREATIAELQWLIGTITSARLAGKDIY